MMKDQLVGNRSQQNITCENLKQVLQTIASRRKMAHTNKTSDKIGEYNIQLELEYDLSIVLT